MPLDIAIYMHNKKKDNSYNNRLNIPTANRINVLIANAREYQINIEKINNSIHRLVSKSDFDIYKEMYAHIFI